MTATEKQLQIADQCKAIAHMASALAGVHSDYEKLFREGRMPDDFDMVGRRTASFMEQLGDMLNAIDGCTEEDEWMEPVFEAAHRLYPPPPSAPGGMRVD